MKKNCSDCKHNEGRACNAPTNHTSRLCSVQRARGGFLSPILIGTCGQRARWFVAKVAA